MVSQDVRAVSGGPALLEAWARWVLRFARVRPTSECRRRQLCPG